MTDLEWLCDWYRERCNGEWEHEFGIAIDTLDNPGWSLRIDLVATGLDGAPFPGEEIEDGDKWVRLWKDSNSNVFHGSCSPTMLPSMLERFRRWATHEVAS